MLRLGLSLLGLSLVGCGDATVGAESNRVGCIDRGIAYFKEIEAYPKLSDGRDAVTTARERCARTPSAF
ncbi:MAG: hypothetical protein EOP84_24155 [Verrucomicrobiaceae bacterium]|nr:MAG: hypothetical protein EOP84_24155 [Verrucomicrobiaceae bacterium]